MIPRPQAGTQQQRPAPPQRVSSTGPHRPLNRPALPSKLSNVRTATQTQQDHAAKQYLPHNPNSHHLTANRPNGPDGTYSTNVTNVTNTTHVKQEPTSVRAEVVDVEDERQIKNENNKAHSANGYLTDGQSPRQWDAPSVPHTPTLPPKTQALPMPARPAFMADVKQQPRSLTVAARSRRDPARRSSGLLAPAVATALPRGKVADFFPWTGVPGAHSEDVLNELWVKNGNNDKPGTNCPNIAAESNTARPNLWPSLKNKNGMQILSALFCQVLDKRQQMGRCTAPSTFKPPPRVTLTDTKREIWLKDLADPTVPLRRLSRTIPHGVRGKVLLDHCITKDIPIARAVWLSKCVGANEIRAFKRKGVSGPSAFAGELKWIREWTGCVEDFVDAIISECGHPGWSRKMNYAIRLATYFFSEHLLDGEHYIDWLLTSLETSSTERLPVWVLLTQVYWKHLISQRKRGRRLADALLAHTQALTSNASAEQGPLILRLQQLISILAIAHQGCLLMPRTWKGHQSVVRAIASLEKFAHAKDALCNAQKRNLRILGSVNPMFNGRGRSKQTLIDELDRVGLSGEVPRCALPNGGAAQSGKSILPIVLEWATSRHRQGMARVYLAARILRQWNITGFQTDDIILETLEAAALGPDVDTDPLCKIIALLARSGHFSVGKYLQWLISVGALSGIPTASNDAQLLLELPTDRLQSHVLNLRRAILNRMGCGAQAEQEELEGYKVYLSSLLRVASANKPAEYAFANQSMQSPPTPSGAVRLTVAQWLYTGLTAIRDAAYTADDRTFKGGLQVFCLVRQTFERFEDFLSLSGCIKAASGSTMDPAFLATLADTINRHAEVFAAMGVLSDLTTRLCKHQQELRRRSPLDKTFLLALTSLVLRVPCDDAVRSAIMTDLQYCETQGSAAACSPASDSMVMTAGGVPDSDDDINRVLASGNTMDELLFSRMFSIIADRAMKAGFSGTTRTGGWFFQLRRFDPATFDQLLHALMNRLKEAAFTSRTFVEVTAALVGSGCMKIDLPLRTLERQIIASGDTTTVDRFSKIYLELTLPLGSSKNIPSSPELYKFRLEQHLFRQRNGDEIMRIMFIATGNNAPSCSEYANDASVLAFLRQHINKGNDIPAQFLFGQTNRPSNNTPIRRLLDNLMSPSNTAADPFATPLSRIQRILASANELSLRSCQLALKHCFASVSLGEEDKLSVARVFQQSIEQDSPVWPELVTASDKGLVYQIHSWARDRATSLMSEFVSATDSSVKIDEIRRYLTAADIASSPSETQSGQPQTFSLLNDHLSSIGKLVDTLNPLDVGQAPQRQRVSFGLDMLLQLTTRHFQSSTDDFISTNEVITLTTTLALLLIHQRLQNQRAILEYLLDVTSLIVDALSPEAMSSIIKNLPAYARQDPRIRYLFGITFTPDSWLALASKIYAQQTAPAPTQGSVTSSLPRPSHPLPPRPGSVGMVQRQSSMTGIQNPGNPQQTLQQQQQRQSTTAPRGPYEVKYNPFPIRRWEIMPDPTPNMGPNDTSLSLGLFQARKVI